MKIAQVPTNKGDGVKQKQTKYRNRGRNNSKPNKKVSWFADQPKKHFGIFPAEFSRDKRLTFGAKALMLELMLHADITGIVNPAFSLATMANQAGIEKKQAQDYLGLLVETGWVIREKRSGKPSLLTLQLGSINATAPANAITKLAIPAATTERNLAPITPDSAIAPKGIGQDLWDEMDEVEREMFLEDGTVMCSQRAERLEREELDKYGYPDDF